jgi:hypothetical protein
MLGPVGNSISTLQKRGVVFLACHNAIWESAARLIQSYRNPDRKIARGSGRRINQPSCRRRGTYSGNRCDDCRAAAGRFPLRSVKRRVPPLVRGSAIP